MLLTPVPKCSAFELGERELVKRNGLRTAKVAVAAATQEQSSSNARRVRRTSEQKTTWHSPQFKRTETW